MTTAIAKTNDTFSGQILLVKQQMEMIRDCQRQIMVNGEDFGIIPGTGSKPTLLKPGAEKLCMLFKLSTKIEKTIREMPGGHREYEITVTLHRREEDGEFFGAGVGICSTMESKYRWRNQGRKCPVCGKEAIIKGKAEYGGGYVCFKKKDGCGAKFSDQDERITAQNVGKTENPDIADTYNTVLKMSKKRALVDAVLTATAASQLFTQDLEEMHEPAPEVYDAPEEKATVPAIPVSAIIDKAQRTILVNAAKAAGMDPRMIAEHFRLEPGQYLLAAKFDEAMKFIADFAAKKNGVQDAPSADQMDKMGTLASQSGMSEDDLVATLQERFQVGHPSKLTRGQADEFVAWLEKVNEDAAAPV